LKKAFQSQLVSCKCICGGAKDFLYAARAPTLAKWFDILQACVFLTLRPVHRLKNQGTIRESADLTVEAYPLIGSTNLAKNSAQPSVGDGIHVPQSGDFEPFRCDAGSAQAWHNGEHACCLLFASS